MAQLYFRETRELHTLGAFDLVNLRRDLAADVGRFAGAAALTEVMLNMAPPAPLVAGDGTRRGGAARGAPPQDGAAAAARRPARPAHRRARRARAGAPGPGRGRRGACRT